MWRSVRVFVSSTFRDMGAERDALAKQVFPALRARLAPYRIDVIDVDLRWGLVEDLEESDELLKACLAQVEACYPFLVGLIGDVYGSVVRRAGPHSSGLPGVAGVICSITELEYERFEHSAQRGSGARPRALYYLRAASAVESVPEEVRNARYVDADPEHRAALARFKRRLRAAGVVSVDGYAAAWDATRLDPFKQVPGTLLGFDGLMEAVENDLFTGIVQELGLQAPAPGADDLPAKALDEHDDFVDREAPGFVGRSAEVQALERHLEAGAGRALLVAGEMGSGKTALLAHLVRRWRATRPKTLVVPHFVGAGAASFSLDRALHRFAAAMTGTLECLLVLDGLDDLDDAPRACSLDWLPDALPTNVHIVCSARAVANRDAPVNGITIIPDAREIDFDASDAVAHATSRGIPVLSLTPLQPCDIDAVVSSATARFGKRLRAPERAALLAAAAGGNALYLTVLLEEARLFGSSERLLAFLCSMPALDSARADDHSGSQPLRLARLFHDLVIRLCNEFNPALVVNLLGWLDCSRTGLAVDELDSLCDHAFSTSAIAGLMRRLRPYLHLRENRWLVRYPALTLAFRFHVPGVAPLPPFQQRCSRVARMFESLPASERKAVEYPYLLSRGTDDDRARLCSALFGDPDLFWCLWQLDTQLVRQYAAASTAFALGIDGGKVLELVRVVTASVATLEDRAHACYARDDIEGVLLACSQQEALCLLAELDEGLTTARLNRMLTLSACDDWEGCRNAYLEHRQRARSRQDDAALVAVLVPLLLQCAALNRPMIAATYLDDLRDASGSAAGLRQLRAMQAKGQHLARLVPCLRSFEVWFVRHDSANLAHTCRGLAFRLLPLTAADIDTQAS